MDMKRYIFLVSLVSLFICSCSMKSIEVSGNIMTLKKGTKTVHELIFDSFELVEKEKNNKDIIIIGYEYRDNLDIVGYPLYGDYIGNLYISIDGKKLKPVLNIVHEYRQTFGSRIKLLNKTVTDDIIDVEYDVQLYDEARAAGFGTVKIRYKQMTDDSGKIEYEVIDYENDLKSYFKRVSDENPNMMIPSMEGDIISKVDFSFEEFKEIADQIYDFIK